MGLQESEIGPIPFAYSVEVGSEIPDGKIDVGAEGLDERVTKAIDASKPAILEMIDEQKIRIGAEQLVERARVGDQNAEAMISAVSQEARANPENTKANRALACILDYIRTHPADSDSHYLPQNRVVKQLGAHVGEEAAISAWTPALRDVHVAAIVLQRGPKMVKNRIEEIGSYFGADIDAFRYGVVHWKEPIPSVEDESRAQAVFTGQAVGMARILQGVGDGTLPVSRLCPIAGAELGE